MKEIPHLQTLHSGEVTSDGNTQSTPKKCRWAKEATFFLYISEISGTLDIEIQTKDPNTGQWHKLAEFDQKSTTGTDEGFIEYGIGAELAVKYVVSNSATFTLNVYLKG
jgi:hypothetical protein